MSTSESIQTLFRQAVQSYKVGDRATALKHMRQVLLEDPNHVPGWLWMSGLVDDLEKQRECLERALALDPKNEAAHRGLRMLRLRQTAQAVEEKTHAEPAPVSAPPTKPSFIDASQREAGKLGEYLVEQGVITSKQLETALEEQRQFWKKFQGARAPLGNILINNGILTPETLATALVIQQRDKLQGRNRQSPQFIGEYLVARGIITSEQLEAVLAEQIRLRQRGTSLLIGELLIHAGYVTREVLEKVLEQQRDEMFNRFGFED